MYYPLRAEGKRTHQVPERNDPDNYPLRKRVRHDVSKFDTSSIRYVDVRYDILVSNFDTIYRSLKPVRYDKSKFDSIYWYRIAIRYIEVRDRFDTIYRSSIRYIDIEFRYDISISIPFRYDISKNDTIYRSSIFRCIERIDTIFNTGALAVTLFLVRSSFPPSDLANWQQSPQASSGDLQRPLSVLHEGGRQGAGGPDRPGDAAAASRPKCCPCPWCCFCCCCSCCCT